VWLGRCVCGRDIVVPTGVVEAIVRVRALLRGQRLGPRPFQHPGRWAYGVIGLMRGIFVGLVIAPSKRAVDPTPLYLGDFVTAKHFNATAALLGCPHVEAVDGERLSDAMRALHRCLHDRDGRTDFH